MTKVMQLDIDKGGKKRLIYTDGTGRFPKQSRTGQNYIMVMAENDSDAILVEGMKNRLAGEMVRAYKVLIGRLHASGIFPTKQVLDNEISDLYKEAIESFKMEYELVPPHNHEHAIRLRGRSRPSRITSWQSSAAPTRISHCTCGRTFYNKQNTP